MTAVVTDTQDTQKCARVNANAIAHPFALSLPSPAACSAPCLTLPVRLSCFAMTTHTTTQVVHHPPTLELRGTWTGTLDKEEYVVHADGTCSLGLVQRAENIALASDGTVSMGRIYRGEELQYDGQVRS